MPTALACSLPTRHVLLFVLFLPIIDHSGTRSPVLVVFGFEKKKWNKEKWLECERMWIPSSLQGNLDGKKQGRAFFFVFFEWLCWTTQRKELLILTIRVFLQAVVRNEISTFWCQMSSPIVRMINCRNRSQIEKKRKKKKRQRTREWLGTKHWTTL